jgi:hypothetical protein
MVQRFDLYGAVHKGQRRAIFNLGIKAGSLDPGDSMALVGLMKDLVELRDEIRSHAALEERFIHPILSARSAGAARSLEADHREMHMMFDDMVEQLETTQGKDIPPEVQGDMVKEFYHSWCRFASFYLIHIDGEDEYIQPTLWRLCTDQELMKLFSDIVAYQKPEELMYGLGMMLPAMAPMERTELLVGARGTMTPQAFQGAMEIAKRVLSPTEFMRLKDELG